MVNFRKIAFLGIASFFVLLLAAAIAVPIGFRSYLHSEAFRRKIGAAAGQALKAEAEFEAPQITSTTAYTAGFHALGSPASAFRELQANQIRADFNWRGLFDHKWQIDELAVEKLDVQLADREPREREPEPKPPSAPAAETRAPAGPQWKLDLRKAHVRDSRWRWGGTVTPAGELAHAALTVTPSGEAWLMSVTGGRLRQTDWPEIGVENAQLRYQGNTLFITESRLEQGSGVARVTGEIEFDQQLELQVALDGLDLTPLLTGDWRARLTGRISGDGTVRAPLGSGSKAGPTITGSARLLGGQLTALPLLDQIATFTRTQRFRTVALSTASLDFTHTAERFTARHVIAEAEGLIRMEGDFTVAGGLLEGTFQVGVTAASLQWLPGSQSRVFTVARNGYYWAPMRLTGPVDHPTEDLTNRLIQAAAGEVVQGVETTVKEGVKVIEGTAKGLLDRLLK